MSTQTAASFCRNCGKALSDDEKSLASIYCGSCAAQHAAPPPSYSSAAAGGSASGMTLVADTSVSPGLAFLLGLIPGVGAIYNGQYAKGLVHVFIFGLLISLLGESRSDTGPLLGMLVGGFYFYMPFEAYHTAQRRQRGQPVDEFSSIIPMKGRAGGLPVGPIIMIAIGVLFLLNNFEFVRISQVLRFWPMGLIVLGVYMLRDRMRALRPPPTPPALYEPYGQNREVPHE